MIKDYIKKKIKKTGTYRILEIEKNKLEDQVKNLNTTNEKLENKVNRLERINLDQERLKNSLKAEIRSLKQIYLKEDIIFT